MLKFISSHLKKKAQYSFLDELQDVDWGDNQTEQESDRYSLNPPGSIDESNYEDVLVDNIEDPQENIPEGLSPTEFEQYQRELPTTNELLGIPEDTPEIEYDKPIKMVYDGIDNQEVISFEYTNRHGMYAGRRIVEPHYSFIARTTGNEVLVTFDRDQNDIRTFIIANIHPYGSRYEGVHFEPRPEIMSGIY